MADLPYKERINIQQGHKPYSVDPYNEVGIPAKERDALLVSEFMESYLALSQSVSENVDNRYHQMGEQFGR